jgi:hypothetical protein
MQRRAVLLGSAWIATVFATPTREWLLDWREDDTAHTGNRRVGAAEVDVVWSMCDAFDIADRRLGGGYGRTTLVHYVNQVVLPLLEGTYSETMGRSLLAATARLCDLAGFIAFDSGAQGLGQRYYVQARAGQRAAEQSGSYSTLARCCAMESRAHARQGDDRQCGRAMTRAEQALERVQAEDEPPWIRFFNATALHAEFAYAAADLGRSDDVRAFAPAVLADSDEMERRRMLVAATLASSYLTSPHRGSATVDVDRACATLVEAVPLVQILTSNRCVEAVNQIRRQLVPYRDQEPVRELESTFGALFRAAQRP